MHTMSLFFERFTPFIESHTTLDNFILRDTKLHNYSNNRTHKLLTSLTTMALAVLALSACGGDGSGTDSNTAGTGNAGNATPAAVTLSGQVTDGPIAGARVCLFSNGVQAKTNAGDAICSSQTDAQGNYTVSIPKSLASGLLALIATKGSDIKLTSILGTLDQVLAAAGTGTAVSPTELSSATVTHLTTASFALADTDHDGIVSQTELNAYAPDFAAIQKAATIIQAYVDGGKTTLIGGATTDTLSLASAAVQNKALGTTGMTSEQWFADPANAQTIVAANQALVATLAKELTGKLAPYTLTKTATQQTIPAPIAIKGGTASIYCSSDRTLNKAIVSDVAIALDAARNVALVRYTADNGSLAYVTGSYNPKNGAFSLYESQPKGVSSVQGAVTFYEEGNSKNVGTIDSNGNISGTYEEKWAVTWSLDETRQSCSESGPFTLTKKS